MASRVVSVGSRLKGLLSIARQAKKTAPMCWDVFCDMTRNDSPIEFSCISPPKHPPQFRVSRQVVSPPTEKPWSPFLSITNARLPGSEQILSRCRAIRIQRPPCALSVSTASHCGAITIEVGLIGYSMRGRETRKHLRGQGRRRGVGAGGTPEVCALTRRVRVLSRRVNERGRDIQ